MAHSINIEKSKELAAFLLEQQLTHPDDFLKFEVLEGGVSNRTVLVRREKGPDWVFKQALKKLRVETNWYSATERIHQEANGLRWLMKIIPDNVPQFVFENKDYCILGMTAVSSPHTNWKADLLKGKIDSIQVHKFGQLLAQIHHAVEDYPSLAREFNNYSFFQSLRIEPYYSFTATRVNEAKDYLQSLIKETKKRKFSLVHGDYSPKNVLIHHQQMFLLDYEVMHFGDPAFDLGFSLTHFISKAHVLPPFKEKFLESALIYWKSYQQEIPKESMDPELESFAVKHTLACMLARVYGRSPLEYFDESQRKRQKKMTLEIMAQKPQTIAELLLHIKQYLKM